MMDGLAAWLTAHGQELILSALVGLEKTKFNCFSAYS